MHVGHSADDVVHEAGFGIYRDVRLQAEVPVVALAGLVHRGVSTTSAVLGRTRQEEVVALDLLIRQSNMVSL